MMSRLLRMFGCPECARLKQRVQTLEHQLGAETRRALSYAQKRHEAEVEHARRLAHEQAACRAVEHRLEKANQMIRHLSTAIEKGKPPAPQIEDIPQPVRRNQW